MQNNNYLFIVLYYKLENSYPILYGIITHDLSAKKEKVRRRPPQKLSLDHSKIQDDS